ncbi:MAG: pantetheine-phosphate adenylyltransferase [Vampirovibrionales bacterium]|nr:pantetheine-phosphate adenylyltransferase [Vampirovibrionales bacterium]
MPTAIYPGSFDPVTLGHIDIVTRASKMFDKIVMAVVKNTNKSSLMTLEERVSLIQDCTAHLKNVTVQGFDGLTVDLARKHKAKVIIRGLRAVSDFEFEFMMSQMNKSLNAEVETLFMMAGLEYQFLSSSLVKEVAKLGGDISKVVPAQAEALIKEKTARLKQLNEAGQSL